MAPNRTPDAPGAKPDKGPPSNIALPPVDASPVGNRQGDLLP